MSKKADPVEDADMEALVKVEPEPAATHDIQNYLTTFNKDLEGGSEVVRDGNTYYVDSNGQFYCSQRVICVAPTGENGADVIEAVEGAVGDPLGAGAAGEVQTVTLTGGEGEPVLLNAGSAYGTMTLVPQETNGEVSYVLFMPSHAQPKQEDEEMDVRQPIEEDEEQEEEMDDQDLTVYDFDEEGAANEQTGDSEVEEEKPKVMKVTAKKSVQAITTAHMCNYCNYTSSKRYLLSRHMKSHSEERPHKCSLCERGFKTLSSLQNHVNTHTGTKPHQCRYCDSTFTTSGELVRHVRYKHTHEKPHRCSECDYASVELSKLKRHVRCHTGERPYQCPHCTYASPDTFKLKRHLRIHTGEKPYQCDICHARFTQSNSLKAHKLIHSVADKPVFRCELCPATCGRKTDLRIHVQKLHTSDRLLKCTRCGASFPDRYSFRVHSKTHEGEKCFRCGLCPYASTSARHLESHMLIHTDQKPYQCDMCDQSFRQKQLLKRHQNLYHTPDYIPPAPREKTHECPECGRPFRHKGNLMRHLAVHDPDSPSQKTALALKIGRQKKVHFVDGQQVELITDDDEAASDTGVVMSDSNGQPYVVLEVIQLPDGSGTEFVMAGDDSTDTKGGMDIIEETEAETLDESMADVKQLIKVERRGNKAEGINNCFGFGEDEEDEGDEEEEDEAEELEEDPDES